LLEVVEHQQEAPVPQEGGDLPGDGATTALPEPQRLGDGPEHEAGVRDRGEGDEGDPVRELVADHLPRDR
jgi:hypothetical protein